MHNLHDPFEALMNFCGKYCYNIISLTCFTSAMLVSTIANRLNLPEEILLARHACFSTWMFTMLISLLLVYSPRVRNRKFKTCRLAIIHWLMLSTVAPLIAPFIVAVTKGVPLSFLYVTLLTLFLSIQDIPKVIQRFEDSQNDRTDDQSHNQND